MAVSACNKIMVLIHSFSLLSFSMPPTLYYHSLSYDFRCGNQLLHLIFNSLKQATLHRCFILFFFCCYHREERRIRKWRKMIGVGGSDWKHYVRRNPHVVKRRIRKGIPDCLRGLVWQLISGSRDLLLMNPGVYEVPIMIISSYFFWNFIPFWFS